MAGCTDLGQKWYRPLEFVP